MNNNIIDKSNLEPNAKLYKYMDLEKFLSLIVRSELCFCNQKNLKQMDPYEGAMTKGELCREAFVKYWFDAAKSGGFNYLKICCDEKNVVIDLNKADSFKIYNDDIYYINCWHINKYESLAMWKVFSNNKNSIAISTTKQRLTSSLNTGSRNIYMQKVKYSNLFNPENISVDVRTISCGKNKDLCIDSQILSGFCTENGLLRKTNYYSYEKELRMYFQDNDNKEITKFVKADLDLMIDEIIISPNCDEWFLDILTNILHKYALNKKVKYSDIRHNNIKLSKSELQDIKKIIDNMKFTLAKE